MWLRGARAPLKKLFEKNNYSADAVYNGEDALRKLRERGCKIPVLMLTAKAEIDDKVLRHPDGSPRELRVKLRPHRTATFGLK